MAPIKGSISKRILFGHLLGGFRQSAIGSGFFPGGGDDMHLGAVCSCLLLMWFVRNSDRGSGPWGSSRALAIRKEGRSGGIVGNWMGNWQPEEA